MARVDSASKRADYVRDPPGRGGLAVGTTDPAGESETPGDPVRVENIHATIFDRFAQAPEEQRRGRGHGLGLTIAQGIAELHCGSISAENCEDRGCTFIVDLPLYSPNATSNDPATGTGTSR